MVEAFRFAVVGLTQNAVNLGAFAAMVSLAFDYRLAAVLAGGIALILSFVLNRVWTFRRDENGGLRSEAVRYACVYAASVLVGLGILSVFVEFADTSEVVAQALAIIIVAPFSFFAQRQWTFARR